MFDQILQLVKEHMASNPQAAGNIPDDQADAIHREIATHISNGLQNQPQAAAPAGGILSDIENSLTSGGMVTNAISGGLVGSLGSKFGLSPAITGAIAAALPGILQKFTHQGTVPAQPANS
jgi:uncharacterized protein YidB (DUF937 family)